MTRPFRRLPGRAQAGCVSVCVAVMAAPAPAQTISGTLVDAETRRPIALGLVMMFTESGDSITSTVTATEGSFRLDSDSPGSFILVAAAFGYGETPAGVFELGEHGEMTVEFRIAPEPLPIDELVVSLNRPVLEHALVRNGFVRRYQRGLGHFITPHDIERSSARSTEALFHGVTGVNVRTVNTAFNLSERVQLRGTGGAWCDPNIFVDGIRIPYDYEGGDRLTHIVPLRTLEAVEVYRRPAEIPVEYGIAQSGSGRGESVGLCGVLLFWTKRR